MNVRARSREVSLSLRQFLLARIGSGELRPGDRLPTERELAEQFSSGRGTIRRTLEELEKEGLIRREIGRGTFVGTAASSNAGEHFGRSLSSEIAAVPRLASPADVMELRLNLEPSVVEQAVSRASAAEIETMYEYLRAAKESVTLEEFEHWDDMLHRSFAAASRNPLNVAIYAIVSAVRLEAQWGEMKRRTLTDSMKKAHFGEHVAIVDAVRDRDARTASALMHEHLAHIQENMFGASVRRRAYVAGSRARPAR